tara:strand:+ start:19733 stop:20239 length:507 start_codon:yes stop_codon:yes gene_type:complete
MFGKIIKMSNKLDEGGFSDEANSLDSLLSDLKELLGPHLSEDAADDEGGDSKEDSDSQVTFKDYSTKYFDLCPGAVAAFSKLKELSLDEDASDLVMASLQTTDELLGIESKALEAESASSEDLKSALRAARDVSHFAGILSTMLETDLSSDFEFVDMHVQKIAENLPS